MVDDIFDPPSLTREPKPARSPAADVPWSRLYGKFVWVVFARTKVQGLFGLVNINMIYIYNDYIIYAYTHTWIFFENACVLSNYLLWNDITDSLSRYQLGAGGCPDSAEATVHIMNEFIGSMSLGQPKKWGKGLRMAALARHDRTCKNTHKLAIPEYLLVLTDAVSSSALNLWHSFSISKYCGFS